MIEIPKESEKRLLKAITYLKVAGNSIGECARYVSPFKASKFLNVMMKEIYQIEIELRAYLKGEMPNQSQLWDRNMSTYRIMEAMKEDELLKEV